jgi:hypothetical protein
MRAQRVTRHTSIRYSSSYHTRINMGPSIFFTTYIPLLPRNLADLEVRIIAAVKNIDAPMLTRVWQEQYRIDVCHVISGAHIKHL